MKIKVSKIYLNMIIKNVITSIFNKSNRHPFYQKKKKRLDS